MPMPTTRSEAMRASLLLLASPLCSAAPVRIGLTGDVNLNPFIYQTHPGQYDYPWGNTLPTLKGLDSFFVNHEATIANIVDANPNNFQMEDPVNYTQTFVEAGVDVVSLANNHQFDYNRTGVDKTRSVAASFGIAAPVAHQRSNAGPSHAMHTRRF
jgi:poly-gamma-glutamate capsule biosynthesis protein CapA/YwtB (metallophosphatase superfamily)